MGKNLLLFGPPGVGKGTQAGRLAAWLGVPHVATGDMFREAIKSGTPLGRKVAAVIAAGQLVPDAIACDMIAERLARPDAAHGFLLDGFPRTVPQAESLARTLAGIGCTVDAVVALDAPADVLVGRIGGRRTCEGCHASYHATHMPPRVAGVCDRCGSRLVQRPDDDEAAVRHRLDEYAAKTAPVMDFFRAHGWPVRKVNAGGDVEAVQANIRAAL